MVTREDLESFLIRMDIEYEEVDEGMYLVRGRNSGLPVVVHHADALLLIRMKLMDLPETLASEMELYRTLLELNATDVVHGAYGIEEGELILSDTLELETLDFHELRASMESIELAATGHMERVRALAGVAAADNSAAEGAEG
ncbi:MAG: CesT family type III secretion system chaperone [Longimicrobiales bacterium]